MMTVHDVGHEVKEPLIFNLKPHSCCQELGTFHTSPFCARQGPQLQPMSRPVISVALCLRLPQPATLAWQKVDSSQPP